MDRDQTSRSEPLLRRARRDEARELAQLYLASRRASVPQIPLPVHTDEEVEEYFAESVLTSCEVWVFEQAGELVALMALSGATACELEQLYVHPSRTGQGLGSAMVAQAKSARSSLGLWTFEANAGARRFYGRHGFKEVARTDGDNEERAPDVRCEWRSAD